MVRNKHYAAVVLALALLTGCVTGDDEAPGAGDDASSYADLLGTEIRGMSEGEVETLRTGGGGGMALAAELNGYPGPLHVLEHADDLELTEDQEVRVREIREAMLEAAKSVGEEILEQEKRLEAAFRDGTIDAESLKERTRAIALLRGELRAVHWDAHLDTLPVLTHEQVQQYNELRGYGDGAHAGHDHDAHDHASHDHAGHH
jgi:Spy/CpxP family protein refolding chaperone